MVMVQLLVVAAAFAVTDAVWLKLMNPFYRGRAGELLQTNHT
jgi:predicted outer membrane lipoprotein